MSNSHTSPSDQELKEAAKELASTRAQERRARIENVLQEWVWVSGPTSFVRTSDHMIWSDRQWRSHFAHLKPDGDILNYIMRQGLVTKYETLRYEPYQDTVIDGTAYNLWRPGDITPREGDVSWFVDHVSYLFPDAAVADMVLDFMAILVREPWTKILFALLIYGPHHGTGKTALSELLKRMLGPHNVTSPSNEELSSNYTSWHEGACLVVVNELMMLNRMQAANRLKTDITEPELRIRAMYRGAYSTPNRLNFFCSTNHPDAAKIENADRRWLVAHSPVTPRPSKYYTALFQHIGSDADVAAVMHLLQSRHVRLNPHGRAPQTQAKLDMIEQAMPDAEACLLELFDDNEEPFTGDLVRRDDLVEAIRQRFPGQHKDLLGRIDTFLKQRLKAVQHKRNTSPGSSSKLRLYSIRNHDAWSAAGPKARDAAYRERRRMKVVTDFEDPEENLAKGLTEDGY
jgi:hypothetical protein